MIAGNAMGLTRREEPAINPPARLAQGPYVARAAPNITRNSAGASPLDSVLVNSLEDVENLVLDDR